MSSLLNLSMSGLLGGLLFSSIGFVAFAYGKKAVKYSFMGVGAVLMAYTFFVTSTLLIYLVGAALTGSLYFVKDWD